MTKMFQAHVICKQLGYPYGAEAIMSNYDLGRLASDYKMFVSALNCTGNENNIKDCGSKVLPHECSSRYNPAGIVCRGMQMKQVC